MKRNRSLIPGLVIAFAAVIAVSILSRPLYGGCRNPNLVIGDPSIQFVAAHGPIEIKWFGHAFFQLTTSSGTRVIADPFGAMGFPLPDVTADLVTVGREHGNHANVGLVKGDPLVLHGVKQDDSGWNYIDTTVRDVLVYNVPIHQRGVPQAWGLRGSAFVFEMDGLCVLHSGDVSEPFNEDQLQMIGHVDILLQTIGGVFTIGPEDAHQVIEQLKPKIVIPMHYWYNNNALERFTQGPYKVVTPDSNTLTVSKETLPPETEIVVLKVKTDGAL